MLPRFRKLAERLRRGSRPDDRVRALQEGEARSPAAGGDLGVDQGRVEAAVPEEDPDVLEAPAGVEEVGRRRVAEGMPADQVPREPGRPAGAAHELVDPLRGEPRHHPPAVVAPTLAAREEDVLVEGRLPAPRREPPGGEPGLDEGHEGGEEGELARQAPFQAWDPDSPAREIEVREEEPPDLAGGGGRSGTSG